MTIDPQARRLIGLLDQAAALLDAHDEQRWARDLGYAATRLREGDRAAVDLVLSCYGGMGSLNDLVLGGSDGARLDELRTQIYLLARSLRGRRWRTGG